MTEDRKRRPIARPPDIVWAPLAVGGLMGAAGLIGLAAGQPWLFPSLGPTAFLQAETPNLPSSRPYNTIVGHAVGAAAGFAAVALFGLAGAPSVLETGRLTAARVGAAVVAVVLTMLLKSLLKASHPPAAATTLLLALGAMRPTAHTAATLAVGVLIVAALGEGLRQVRLHLLPPPDDGA